MTFTVQCIHCNKEFQAFRSTAKFCSSTCRSNFRYSKENKIKDQVKRISGKKIEAPVKTKSDLDLTKIKNEKIAKMIMALIKDRRKIVHKGFSKYATFVLGDTVILLGMDEIIIDGVKFNLKK